MATTFARARNLTPERMDDLMGLSIFSHSPGDSTPPNPNPGKFVILATRQRGRFLVAWVRFPGCTTYQGVKLLVYEASAGDFWRRTAVDPHFLGSDQDPVARFPASSAGEDMANAMISSLLGSQG